MFYGRALNGWVVDFKGQDVVATESRRLIANAVIAASSGPLPVCKRDSQMRDDPSCDCDTMHWVHHLRAWGASRISCTAKGSPYWRVVGRIVRNRAGLSPSSMWAPRVAWSNLYKVAPAEGGNPNSALKAAQFEACLQLIQSELAFHKPRAIVFLTESPGEELWFQPFRERLAWTGFKDEGKRLVKATGTFRVADAEYFAVIAEHPQGRPEAGMAARITEILNHNVPAEI